MHILRATLFTLVGVLFFAYWHLADPSYEETKAQSEWTYVLLFSGAILALAFALPLLAGLVSGRVVRGASLLAAAGATLSSLANIVEDGLQQDWAFVVFVLGSVILLPSLLVLIGTMAVVLRGTRRTLALIPGATMVAVIFFVVAGGPLMLATWLTAAALAHFLRTQSEAPAPTSPHY